PDLAAAVHANRSKCTQDSAATKRRMNSAAVMAPPWLPPTLLISATLDSSIDSYGRHNGSRHTGSFSALPRRSNSSATRSSRGEEGRRSGAKRDAGRAGKRCEVGDQYRLVFIGERQRIGEDQPAFGVGIADLHRDALARGIDVARPET